MMEKFNKSIYLFILSVSFLMSGCWDSRDIQNKDIVTSVITDYKKGLYSFVVEIANIRGLQKNNSGKNSESKFSLLQSTGNSFAAARDNLDRKTDSPIFLGATRVIVITTNLAEYGIEEYANRIRGTTDYRKTTPVVTTSTSPEDMLKDVPENDISAGFAIEDTLKAIDNNGIGIHFHIGDVLQAIAVKKAGFVLSQIDIETDENTMTGYSVFKDCKMVGFIPSAESKGLVYLLSSHGKLLYVVNDNENKMTIEASLKKRKIIPEYHQKELKFKVFLELEGQILYMNELFPIDEKRKTKYADILKDLVYEDIMTTIKTSQKEFLCDYLGFYKYFKISYPQAFRTINWNDEYSNATIELDIKTKVKAAGLSDINPKKNE